jgi:hypothetical protein
MGTRASVIFKENSKNVVAIYRQYDGYVRCGLGDELVEIISSGKVGNGITFPRPKLGEYFNGAGCLFATVVAKLKDEAGSVYICPVNEVGNQGEDYIYTVEVNKGKVNISVMGGDYDEETLMVSI